jgi:hypothetical protein
LFYISVKFDGKALISDNWGNEFFF